MSLRSEVTSQPDPEVLRQRYRDIRSFSTALTSPLSTEDRQIQSMPDASPTKWHLAHTTWFFETFILVNYLKGYRRFNEDFNYLYNSYYNGIGAQFPRMSRGMVTRPSSDQIDDYRAFVDQHMEKLIEDSHHSEAGVVAFLTELGTHHEQQHQELILSDIKHGFSLNSTDPAYCPFQPSLVKKALKMRWVPFDEGIYTIGYQGDGFAYDNEKPAHKRWLDSFSVASRPVVNREYIDFIEDGGYEKSELWLSEGWAFIQENQRHHPLYWLKKDTGQWTHFTLSGRQDLDFEEPVCHVNYYEANAYAAWAGARLPSEAEWEAASQSLDRVIDVPPLGRFHPSVAEGKNDLEQMIGEVWEWTSSSYEAYPGFKPLDGAAGEYNGKFMCNQYVLKGGSAITPTAHIRTSYRNFFPTHADWQFSGFRLARNDS